MRDINVFLLWVPIGVCPVLCSGRGDYLNGECQCNPGWKGKECSLRHDECEISDCSAHGKCVNGKCVCGPGYTGQFCEQGTKANFDSFVPLFFLSLFPSSTNGFSLLIHHTYLSLCLCSEHGTGCIHRNIHTFIYLNLSVTFVIHSTTLTHSVS